MTVLVLFLAASLIVFWAGRHTAVSQSADTFSGLAQIEGPLSLQMAVSPPIGAPGDTLHLNIRLNNQMMVTTSPAVSLQLPPGMRLDTSQMPAGLTMNLQTNALTWLPILPANGGAQQIDVALRVETVDINQPAQAITAVLRHEESELTAAAPIWMGMPPHINRVAVPPQVAVGQPVQLVADVGGPGPVVQSWTLGDGRRIDVNDPTLVFATAGVHAVQLTINNPLTSLRETAVSQTASITVVPQPAAQFSPDDTAVGVGQVIQFQNQSGGQPPLIFRWDFGDGTTTIDTTPSHQYAAPGSYVVHLIVENDFGQSEAFWPITVGAPPIADMEVDPSAPAGEPVFGQAFGDDTVTVFRWDMGDGQVYEGQIVTHPYRQGGDYYVSMTAHNEYGGTEIGRWVHIDPGQLTLYLPLILHFDDQANLFGNGSLSADPYGLMLAPVDLDTPFVMGAMELPDGLSQAEQLFFYINEARRQFDLPPLNPVSELHVAADQHVQDMAGYRYTAHAGFDGSFPAERLIWQGYRAGYAGEATAWGFEYPYQAVEFWVNSPAHRRIILNAYATDIGVGYTVDYNAPNVWYWTAEFGNAFAPAAQPFIRVVEPQPELELMISETATFSWNWPVRLEPGQQFTVYRLDESGTAVPLGAAAQPQLDTRYSVTMPASNDWDWVGSYHWQIVLEDGNGIAQLASEMRAITFLPDPNLPTPTPVVTPTAVPTLIVQPTLPPPTATPFVPVFTPRPTQLPPPVIMTATPAP